MAKHLQLQQVQVTQRVENGMTYDQVFDAENRLVSVTVNDDQTTHFYYDGDGNMVKKVEPDGAFMISIDGVYKVHKDNMGQVVSTSTYYPAASAMRLYGSVYYMLSDKLGSTGGMSNSSGSEMGGLDDHPADVAAAMPVIWPRRESGRTGFISSLGDAASG